MFSRLNKTIINAIDSVMNDSVCNFSEWWKDDFETEIIGYLEHNEIYV